MSMHVDPSAVPEPERDRFGGTAARVEIRPAIRVAHLGRRALSCPSCGFPLAISHPVSILEPLACAFCDGVAPGRAYLADGGWPEVDVIARLG
jgi:hypothetical protein